MIIRWLQQQWCRQVRSQHCGIVARPSMYRALWRPGHETVCHKRLRPVSHLWHFRGRPSLTFSISHTADLHCKFRPSADVCVVLSNGFRYKLSAPATGWWQHCNMNICSNSSSWQFRRPFCGATHSYGASQKWRWWQYCGISPSLWNFNASPLISMKLVTFPLASTSAASSNVLK